MSPISQILTDMNMNEKENDPNAVEKSQLITEYRYLYISTILTLLYNNSIFHTLTGIDIFNNKPAVNNINDKPEYL